LAIAVERKERARRLLDQVEVADPDPRIVVLDVRVGGKDVARAFHAADLRRAHSSASPSLMACPGSSREASLTPGANSATTVEPISKIAISPPFSTFTGRS